MKNLYRLFVVFLLTALITMLAIFLVDYKPSKTTSITNSTTHTHTHDHTFGEVPMSALDKVILRFHASKTVYDESLAQYKRYKDIHNRALGEMRKIFIKDNYGNDNYDSDSQYKGKWRNDLGEIERQKATIVSLSNQFLGYFNNNLGSWRYQHSSYNYVYDNFVGRLTSIATGIQTARNRIRVLRAQIRVYEYKVAELQPIIEWSHEKMVELRLQVNKAKIECDELSPEVQYLDIHSTGSPYRRTIPESEVK